MDPVSLSLAIAPLCLSAVKGVKIVKRQIKLLRGYDREVTRLRKRLKTQISIFLDESQLLLLEAVDNSLVNAMLDDLSHEHWNSRELDDFLQGHLGRKYAEAKDAVQQISEQIRSLSEDLGSLENPMGLLLSKTKLETGIAALAESINEFRRLRKTAKSIQKYRTIRQPQRGIMPRSYGLVAKHSASFHEIFVRTWSCHNTIQGAHSHHTARLLLDPHTAGDDVDLKLILEYEAVSGALRQNSLLLLRVRSEDLTWVGASLSTLEPSSLSSRESEEPPKKVRKVTFAETSVQVSVRASEMACSSKQVSSHQTKDDQTTTHNLCKSKDLCQDVFEHAKSLCKARQEACIGYLDSKANLRHRLMMAQDRESTAIQTRRYSPIPLQSILKPSKESSISVNEQLRLALRLARSMLRYHPTPWWRKNWSLADLSYFDIDSELSTSLKTLHIDTKLLRQDEPLPMQGLLQSVPSTAADDDASLFCGIRNVTLHGLGVALLQIGRWEAFGTEDIVQIRKAAAQTSRLGPRYDELTTKCLYCDFGFGADLERPQLQGAVYENIVCELEHMVRLLEGEAVGRRV